MLKEFAIEPEALADAADCRAILDMFVMGRGAYISEFPGRWKRQVYETAKLIARPADLARIEIKLNSVDKRLLLPSGREYDSNPSLSWRDNAWRADTQTPFGCLILKSSDPGHVSTRKVVIAEEVSSSHSEFSEMGQATIVRNAVEISSALGLLVRNARHIKFVDPYFKPGSAFEAPITAILERNIRRTGSQTTVELHTQVESKTRPSEDSIRECFQRIGTALGMIANVRCHPCAEMHNRFLLTDRGGVLLGAGFDGKVTPNITTMTNSDDLVVLNRPQYEEKWVVWSMVA